MQQPQVQVQPQTPLQTQSELELLAGAPLNGESYQAIEACNDFLRLGPGRLLSMLVTRYAQGTEGNRLEPPTTSASTLKKWSMRFGWQVRAAEYDNRELEEPKNERRLRIMEEGLALDYERVAELTELAKFLKAQIYETGVGGEYHNVWMPDVKQVGAGETVERVNIERFNGALISEFRATLDDIAKETGGRIRKTDVTSNGETLAKLYSGIDIERV